MVRTSNKSQPVDADEAVVQILEGTAPDGLEVAGPLEFVNDEQLTQLPARLTVRRLVLQDCPKLERLPDGLRVRHLDLHGCPLVTALPEGLRCYEIRARESNLVGLPPDLHVDFRLDLQDSRKLTALPDGLKVGTLVLRGCTALERLPEGLDVCFLDLEGCPQLKAWPKRMTVSCGNLNLAGCAGLTRFPPGVTEVAQLDLRNCAGITGLPPGLEVRSWIDVAGSGLMKLPRSLKGVRLRWRGVAVNERVAFQPETLTAEEVLKEPNAEVRRVMMDRVGFERFLNGAGAEALDADCDPGGERQLLRIALPDDEPLVCLSVFCPSTGRRYVLRVPPTMTTCKQAAAWMAGFDDPADYQPAVET